MLPCFSSPPLTALGSPMRPKSVFVSQPSPLNPFPPFSAGTDASAPESGFVNTGYEFLSAETLLGAEAEGAAVPVLPAGGGVDPPPQAAVITITPTSPANELCSRLTSPSQISILLRDQRLQWRRHGPSPRQPVRRSRAFRQFARRPGASPGDGLGQAGRVRRAEHHDQPC